MSLNLHLDEKVWVGLLDGLISVVLYFAGKYGMPGLVDDMKIVILAIQPVFLAIIAAYYQAQQAAIARGVMPSFMAK